ncbi:MAG: type III pantothenate kinase [Calditrichaeota bacterium]|nr:type III pantothenate kinase [Calditrichota bacterium]
MLLAFDIGNTHTVVGCFEDGRLINHWRITSEMARTEDELGVLLHHFFSQNSLDFKEITGVCISSVVPDLTEIYQYLSRRYLRYEPLLVNSALDLGMKIKYKDPDAVGADRLCNAVAGVQKYGAPVMIVDFGTATTIDCIDKNGDYLGGVIAPGIITSIEALHLKAAKLPRVNFEFPEQVIGQTTDESIQSGVFWGTVYLIEGLIGRIRKELGAESRVVATGGLANKIIRHTKCIDQVDPYLSLEGIVLIYARNKNISKAVND